MSLLLLLTTLISTLFIESSVSQRRIVGGEEVVYDRPYVVYLVKAPKSTKKYDAWLCGGAIVSPYFIITSAACVEDVEYMYAIAGYNRRVTHDKIDEDECTKNTKKKIVYTCVPKVYTLDYDKIEKWSLVDIAVAKVDKPFVFGERGKELYKHCSYTPTMIGISYKSEHRKTGTSVTTFGWGHTEKFRKPEDTKDYNQILLRLVHTKIMEKKKCADIYGRSIPEMVKIINKYMICTDGSPKFNAYGGDDGCTDYDVYHAAYYRREDCKSQARFYNSLRLGDRSVITDTHKMLDNGTFIRMSSEERNKANRKSSGTSDETSVKFLTETSTKTAAEMSTVTTDRRSISGICQNDHGGPLTTRKDGTEILIGVASVFRLNENNECVGPFLFTSTECNSNFLKCIIESELYRRSYDPYNCYKSDVERGFRFDEKSISWHDHPDG